MVFSSAVFLFVFLPILIVFYFISWKISIKLSNVVLLLFSFIFMLWGGGKDIMILVVMILINYLSGLLLTARGDNTLLLSKNTKRTRFQKGILLLTLVLSLGLLLFFKYALFFADNMKPIMAHFFQGYEIPQVISSVVLPLGISFYTFQALSYTMDVYFGNVPATRSLVRFSLYVSFFPQLIAGPIVRYKDIYNQINQRSITIDNVYQGMIRFVMGFSKKVLLANIMGFAADSVFRLPISELQTGIAWVGIVAYSLQIYLDFSAYSDMAIGLAEIFGFKLLENFNLPYVAISVQDFWRRWHISLSSWFRDYLYIPLGGSRKGKMRTYLNLVIVFFICGFWHGAAWNFVIWGLWHGAFLVIERAFLGDLLKKVPYVIRRVYTLLVVLIGWVLFRAEQLPYGISYLKTMFGMRKENVDQFRNIREFLQNDVIIVALIGIFVSAGGFRKIRAVCNDKSRGYLHAYAIVALILFGLSITSIYSGGYNPFIYFRF